MEGYYRILHPKLARSSSSALVTCLFDSYFSENQTKILLESAVASVQPLRSVKDQADQLFTQTGKLLDYEQHAALLLSATTNYDSKFVSVPTKSTGKVYNTELGGSDFVID